MARAAAVIELSEDEERELRAVLRRPSVSLQQALRARIVLRAAEGATNTQIAAEAGVSLPTVGLWRRSFCERRLEGLADAPRSGRPRTIDDDEVQRVLAMTLETPPDGSTHWSVRRLATATGLSPTTVHRIWREHKLKPHQVRSFKFSKDPQLTEKIVDVVGLYMAPPKGALVLCVDEKSQIQALDRTAPILPMLPGTPQRATHDYKRSGTSSLYAALDITTGQVIGRLHARHRAIEFKKFLQTIDREVPDDLDVHLILDNASTHKTPQIKKWLTAHPRFVVHFTPTSSSWLNLVERWFAELTTKKLRRGTHRSVRQLNSDIRAWIDTWNDNPKPFVWTKTADQILESISRYCNRINESGH